MQIFFKPQADCDYFYFSAQPSMSSILLPVNIETRAFLILIQASLDQIKPVLIVNCEEIVAEIKLQELKSQHFKLEKEQFIFLNYSIRNSLSRFDTTLFNVNSFSEMYDYFLRNLKK